MTPTIWIDGKYYDKADAKISVFDHGLLYGDGVFEGIRVYNRRVFRLHQHLERLYASAKATWSPSTGRYSTRDAVLATWADRSTARTTSA